MNKLNSEGARRAGLYLLIALWLLSAVWAVFRQLGGLSGGSADFYEFYSVSQKFLYGGSHTNIITQTYPPFFQLLLLPFSWMPLAVASVFWFLFCSWMAWLSVRMMYRIVNPGQQDLPRVYFGLPILMVISLILNDLVMGNVNLFILFTIVAGLYWFLQNRPYRSGLVLALGASTKILPAVFILYFLYKRQFKVAGAAIVGVLLFSLLLPPLLLGDKGVEVVTDWTTRITGVTASEEVEQGKWYQRAEMLSASNQSLYAFLSRFLRDIPAVFGAPDSHVNIAHMPVAQLNTLYYVLVVLLAAYLAYLFRRRLDVSSQANRYTLEYALVVVALLVVSPLSWTNYYLFLLLAYYALFHQTRYMETDSPLYRAIPRFLLLAFVLAYLSADPYISAYGLPFITLVLTGGMLLWALRYDERQERVTAG